MKKPLYGFASAAITTLIAVQVSWAANISSQIKSAESAAPAGISASSTIYAFGSNGTLQLLRSGANAYWCMPDDPATKEDDPVCGDRAAMDWLLASRYKWNVQPDKVGIAFIRAEGSRDSASDLYSTGPADANHWAQPGTHVFIVLNNPKILAAMKGSANPASASLAYAIRHVASLSAAVPIN